MKARIGHSFIIAVATTGVAMVLNLAGLTDMDYRIVFLTAGWVGAATFK